MRIRHVKLWAVILALVALPSLASPPSNELSLAVSDFSFLSFFRGAGPYRGIEATYHRPVRSEGFWRSVRIGGGLRTGFPLEGASIPLEAFVQAQLTARVGIWEAAAGPELGIGGYARLARPFYLAGEVLIAEEDARTGPAYLGFVMAPLRFRLFERFVVSALEAQVGTLVPHFGGAIRLQFSFLRLGVLL